MTRSGEDLLAKCDCIIPVPLHRWRLLKRRYNQATLLAREISSNSNLPYLTNVLIRTKNNTSQHEKIT